MHDEGCGVGHDKSEVSLGDVAKGGRLGGYCLAFAVWLQLSGFLVFFFECAFRALVGWMSNAYCDI